MILAPADTLSDTTRCNVADNNSNEIFSDERKTVPM